MSTNRDTSLYDSGPNVASTSGVGSNPEHITSPTGHVPRDNNVSFCYTSYTLILEPKAGCGTGCRNYWRSMSKSISCAADTICPVD